MAHHHDHDHDDHAPIEEGKAPTEFDLLEQAIRELLIEKEVFSRRRSCAAKSTRPTA